MFPGSIERDQFIKWSNELRIIENSQIFCCFSTNYYRVLNNNFVVCEIAVFRKELAVFWNSGTFSENFKKAYKKNTNYCNFISFSCNVANDLIWEGCSRISTVMQII